MYTNTHSIWDVKDPILLHQQRRRAEITRSRLNPQSHDTILDIGCGEGYQASYFANQVSQVVGVDISKNKLKRAKRRLPKHDFIRASSSKLPFRPNIFDKMLCLEVLEHLENPSESIDEINLALKKKGILIISVPYKEQITQERCIHCGKLTPRYGHLHSFDEKKISMILPQNYNLLKHDIICTPASSYYIFAFLPIRLWEIVDTLTRSLPGVRPYWIISKVKKVA